MKSRRRKKLHKKGNVMMSLASMLFVTVFVSTCMLAGLLAKYTATSEGQDGARVAGFSVNVENITAEDDSKMDLGSTKPLAVYAMKITNQSEVAVSYSVELQLKKDLPTGIYVYLANDSEGETPVNVTAVEQMALLRQKYKFVDAGRMQPNTVEQKYLIFAPDPNAKKDSDGTIYDHLDEDSDEDASIYTNEIDFKVNVVFTQID